MAESHAALWRQGRFALASMFALAVLSHAVTVRESETFTRAQRRANNIIDKDHGDRNAAFRWVGAATLDQDNYTITISKVAGGYVGSTVIFLVASVGADWQDRVELLEAEASVLISNGTSTECGFDLDDADDDSDHDHGHGHSHDHDHDHRRDAHAIDTQCADRAEQGSRLAVAGSRSLFVLEVDATMSSTLTALSVEEGGTFLFFCSYPPRDFQHRVPWLQHASGSPVRVEAVVGGLECKSRLSEGEVWVLSLFGTMIGAAMSLVGVVFLFPALQARKAQLILYLHSLAAGVLLALTVVHLIPEAISLVDRPWKATACVMAGFSAGMLLEHCLRIKGHRHEHDAYGFQLDEPAPEPRAASHNSVAGDSMEMVEVGPDNSKPSDPGPAPPMDSAGALLSLQRERSAAGLRGGDEESERGDPETSSVEERLEAKGEGRRENGGAGHAGGHVLLQPGSERAMVLNILVGDLFHNFFDGVVIALAFRMCGAGMGWTVTASAVVHELPQEVSDFVLLVEAGLTMRQALYLNFLSSLSSFLGVMVVLPIGEMTDELNRAMGMLLGVGAGVMLCIAVNLLPGILAVKRWDEARLSWLAFAVGAVGIGLTLLMHVHCDCADTMLEGLLEEDEHAGHNH